MLTTGLRKKIEWHFKDYQADKKLYDAQAKDIAETGLTLDYSRVNCSGGQISSPTETKGIMLLERGNQSLWAKVVENTFNTFRFEPEYELMVKMYIIKMDIKTIINLGFPERTLWYWRDRWLDVAYLWAQEYELL